MKNLALLCFFVLVGSAQGGEKPDQAALRSKAKEPIYPGAAGYDRLNLDCTAGRFHVRVETFGEAVKYFSWPKGASITQKPDLMMTGTVEYEGSANNATYLFKNGDYVYEMNLDNVCGEDSVDQVTGKCATFLLVSKKDKALFSAKCR